MTKYLLHFDGLPERLRAFLWELNAEVIDALSASNRQELALRYLIDAVEMDIDIGIKDGSFPRSDVTTTHLAHGKQLAVAGNIEKAIEALERALPATCRRCPTM